MAKRRPVADKLQCQLKQKLCCLSGKHSNGKKNINEIQTRDSYDEYQLSYRKYQKLKV